MNIPFKQTHASNYRAGRTQEIKYLVIHYTANNGDTAQNNLDYFARTSLKTSAHYFVDEYGIGQSVRDNDTAYHCGATKYKHPDCRNDNSIGIELCSRKDSDGEYFFKPETIRNAVELCQALMEKYSLPAGRILRHYDVTGKMCPAPFVNDPAAWADFCAEAEQTEPTEHWAQKHFESLIEKGIMIKETRFDEPVTRGEIFALLDRLII